MDRLAHPARRLRTRRHDLHPRRAGDERHVRRDGRGPAVSLVPRGKGGRDRRARCRPLLRRGVSREPDTAHGDSVRDGCRLREGG